MPKTLPNPLCLIAIAASLAIPVQGHAQSGTDRQYVRAYQEYWSEIENELNLGGNDCTRVSNRLTDWATRNGEAIDSLNANSAGLMDRLTEAQITALIPQQEPLLFLLATVNGRCRTEDGFREAMATVNKVIGLGS